MAVNEAWGRNLRRAKRAYEDRHDTTLTFAEIGRRVAASLGRATPFAHTSARSWFVEGQEPETFAITAALARVLEVEPATLIPEFGSASGAAAEGGGSRDTPPTAQEVAEFLNKELAASREHDAAHAAADTTAPAAVAKKTANTKGRGRR